jgi:hypothetical protein
MVCNDEDCGRSGRLDAEDRGRSHRLGTRWSSDQEVGWHCVRSTPCTWRREAQISWLSFKTKVYVLSVVWPQNHCDGFLQFSLKTCDDDFLRFWPQNRWLGFFGLGLKTGSSGLMICASKSPWQFFGLSLKIKQASIYWLRHKIDGWRMMRDTCRDLTAYFAWKQVTLGFPSLTLRLAEAWRRVVHVILSRRLHRDQVEYAWVSVTGCVRPCYT